MTKNIFNRNNFWGLELRFQICHWIIKWFFILLLSKCYIWRLNERNWQLHIKLCIEWDSTEISNGSWYTHYLVFLHVIATGYYLMFLDMCVLHIVHELILLLLDGYPTHASNAIINEVISNNAGGYKQ